MWGELQTTHSHLPLHHIHKNLLGNQCTFLCITNVETNMSHPRAYEPSIKAYEFIWKLEKKKDGTYNFQRAGGC